MSRRVFHVLILATLLSGCTMMPRYNRPPAPMSSSWPTEATSGKATETVAADIDWREFFDDPRLQGLIEIALTNNRDLRVAALRVEQARAQYRIQRAQLFPGVQGDASFTRQRFSGAVTAFNGGTTLTTFNLEVGASYEVDLFGRVRSLKKEALEKFVAKEKMTWPQYFDGKGWQNQFGRQFGINGIPAMWLVDKKGVLRDMNGREDLAEKVEKLLAE